MINYVFAYKRGISSCIWMVVILFVKIEVESSCPRVCQCKWRNGKQWVICANAKFIDIPRGLDPSTQVLNLDGNNLKILFRDAFADQKLVNLQKIFLSSCQLRKLEVGSFRMLFNVIEVDLSDNLLESVPSQAFVDISGTRELKLSKNLLTVIPDKAFGQVPDLVYLDLSFNNISQLYSDSFWSLSRLEILKLSGNNIVTIWVSVMKPLVALHEFHLHYNVWNCDCNLRKLLVHMKKKNIGTSEPPTCSSPQRLQNVKWKLLDHEDFVCQPTVYPVEPEVYVKSGNDVTLMCLVEIDTVVNSSWYHNDKLLGASFALKTRKYHQEDHEVISKHNSTKALYFTIYQVTSEFQGAYKCVVRNKAGVSLATVILHVITIVPEMTLRSQNKVLAIGIVLGLSLLTLFFTIIAGILFFRKLQHRLVIKSNSRNGMSLEILKANMSTQERIIEKYNYKGLPTHDYLRNSRSQESVSRANKLCNVFQERKLPNNHDKYDPSNASTVSNDRIPSITSSHLFGNKIPRANNLHQESSNLELLEQQCSDELYKIMRQTSAFSRTPSFDHDWNKLFPDLLKQASQTSSTLPPRRPSNLNMIVSKRKSECAAGSLPHFSVCDSIIYQHSGIDGHHTLSRFDGNLASNNTVIDYGLHARQLEQILHEYKSLQQQLQNIKKTGELVELNIIDSSCETEHL